MTCAFCFGHAVYQAVGNGELVTANCPKCNLSPYQRSVLALKLEEIIRDKARKRQDTSTGGVNPQLKQKSAEAAIETRDELATIAHVSPAATCYNCGHTGPDVKDDKWLEH